MFAFLGSPVQLPLVSRAYMWCSQWSGRCIFTRFSLYFLDIASGSQQDSNSNRTGYPWAESLCSTLSLTATTIINPKIIFSRSEKIFRFLQQKTVRSISSIWRKFVIIVHILLIRVWSIKPSSVLRGAWLTGNGMDPYDAAMLWATCVLSVLLWILLGPFCASFWSSLCPSRRTPMVSRAM